MKTNTGIRRMLAGMLAALIPEYGDNDWRTAVVRGLMNCRAFDMTVVNNYRRNPHVVNGEVL